MHKVLNIIGYIFILLVLALAVVLVVFRFQVFAYLNQINNVGDVNEQTDLDAQTLGIKVDGKTASSSLDMGVIDSEKFKALQAVKVDLTGIVMPGTGTTSTSTANFPVGNSDPFKAF
ncbi:MAG TPA: hypothetical protein PKI61_03530 [bacterium]|nr:hypothetical protein [bacterium]HPT29805.1 hypothetical protein [bacterium]